MSEKKVESIFDATHLSKMSNLLRDYRGQGCCLSSEMSEYWVGIYIDLHTFVTTFGDRFDRIRAYFSHIYGHLVEIGHISIEMCQGIIRHLRGLMD